MSISCCHIHAVLSQFISARSNFFHSLLRTVASGSHIRLDFCTSAAPFRVLLTYIYKDYVDYSTLAEGPMIKELPTLLRLAQHCCPRLLMQLAKRFGGPGSLIPRGLDTAAAPAEAPAASVPTPSPDRDTSSPATSAAATDIPHTLHPFWNVAALTDCGSLTLLARPVVTTSPMVVAARDPDACCPKAVVTTARVCPAILAARSTYFASLLCGPWADARCERTLTLPVW